MVASAKKIKDNASALNDDEVSALEELQNSFDSIKHEISKVLIGQDEACLLYTSDAADE